MSNLSVEEKVERDDAKRGVVKGEEASRTRPAL